MKTAEEWDKEFNKPKYTRMTEAQLIELVQHDAWESATKEQLERDEKYLRVGSRFTYAPFPESNEQEIP